MLLFLWLFCCCLLGFLDSRKRPCLPSSAPKKKCMLIFMIYHLSLGYHGIMVPKKNCVELDIK